MKFVVTVVEVMEKKIEVEVNNYTELAEKLRLTHDDVVILQERKTKELFCEVKDDKNKSYPQIRLI